MKISKLALTLAIGSLALGCVINDDDADGSGTTDASATGTTNTTPGTMTNMTQTGTNTMGQTGDTTEGPSTATDGPTDSGTTAVDPGPFVPDDPDPSLYTQVDRMGMPAITTALITCNDPDPMADDCNDNDYNEAGRAQDVQNAFFVDINASVGALLGGLSPDLTGLGLTPCADLNTCVNQQAVPNIIPDTLSINTATTAGFPNGRLPADQVIDITLAVILLDLGANNAMGDPQTLTTFADVPVSPAANDVAFEKTFPFLAPAH